MRLAFCLLGGALMACGSSPSSDGEGGSGGEGGTGGAPPVPSDCSAPENPEAFELGTGELCFERVAAGQTITTWNGPQGGYHVFLAIGCDDCGSESTVRYSILDPETSAPIEGTYPDSTNYATFVLVDGWPEAVGVQIGLPGIEWDPENEPPLPVGTEILLSVDAMDAARVTVFHHGELLVKLGESQPWNPCDAHPEGECCDPDAMCLGNG